MTNDQGPMTNDIFRERRNALRRLLVEKSLDAFLVIDELNVTYLTGFTGDSTYLLLTEGGELLISDKRYSEQLDEECPDLDRAIRGPGTQLPNFAAEVVAQQGLPSLAIEADAVTVSFYEKLRAALGRVPVANTSGLVESLREVKDAGEIAEIR